MSAANQIGYRSPQLLYLIGNPQISFFKAVYRRHTNFAMEEIEIISNTSLSTKSNNNIDFIITKNGDLVHKMYLDVTLPDVTCSSGETINWTNNTAHAFIKDVSIKIGGFEIDKHTGLALDMWNELTDHNESEHLMLNKHNAKNAYLSQSISGTTLKGARLQIPLKFWFNRNAGLSLPICALSDTEVKIRCTFRDAAELINSKSTSATRSIGSAPEVKLMVQNIYLDTEEKTKFVQSAHEYLIEQLQIPDEKEVKGNSIITFENLHNPIKEVFWVFRNNKSSEGASMTGSPSINTADATVNVSYRHTSDGAGSSTSVTWKNNDYFNYSYGGIEGVVTHPTAALSGASMYSNQEPYVENFETVTIQVNNTDRGQTRPAVYYRTTQPNMVGHRIPKKHVYCYSFSLSPEDYQPSGTCGFSDAKKLGFKFNKEFDTTLDKRKLQLVAVNYNILRIIGGRGGLAFSN